MSNQQRLLTVLSYTGDKCPLFLFPTGSGSVLPWISLAVHIDDRPLYAFRLQGLEGGESPFQSMDEIRDTYEKAIRSVQPRGPYAFLGMSFGAIVAFELAKQFEQLGEEVAFVGSLDGGLRDTMQPTTFGPELLAVDILKLRGVLSSKEAEELIEEYKTKGAGGFITRLIHSHRIALDAAGFTKDSFMAFIRTLDSAVKISLEYEATGKVGRLDVFQANPVATWGITEEQWSTIMQRWTGFVEDIKIHRVSGDHLTLISPPYVVEFHAVLARALACRGI